MRVYHAHMQRAPKAPTNLTVRTDLVRRARRLGLNLSEILETALEAAIRKREREDWLAENRDAIDGYNRRVAKRGVFSDRHRRF
jgi:antitoxin CcdA